MPVIFDAMTHIARHSNAVWHKEVVYRWREYSYFIGTMTPVVGLVSNFWLDFLYETEIHTALRTSYYLMAVRPRKQFNKSVHVWRLVLFD